MGHLNSEVILYFWRLELKTTILETLKGPNQYMFYDLITQMFQKLVAEKNIATQEGEKDLSYLFQRRYIPRKASMHQGGPFC